MNNITMGYEYFIINRETGEILSSWCLSGRWRVGGRNQWSKIWTTSFPEDINDLVDFIPGKTGLEIFSFVTEQINFFMKHGVELVPESEIYTDRFRNARTDPETGKIIKPQGYNFPPSAGDRVWDTMQILKDMDRRYLRILFNLLEITMKYPNAVWSESDELETDELETEDDSSPLDEFNYCDFRERWARGDAKYFGM